jgi:uroporphyrinogen-III decarboxylase
MSLWEKVVDVALGKNKEEIPVVLWAYSLVLKRFEQVTERKYYEDVKVQLRSILAFQKRFPEIVNIHTYPSAGEGVCAISNAFGGKIIWMENSPPYADTIIKEPEDVDKLASVGIPEANVGIAGDLLKKLEYFYDWLPKDLRENYGYLDGVVYAPICVEGAAIAMGYDKFFIWMRLYPDVVHKWLNITTEWYLRYCKAIEDIVGKCKFLIIPDHSPHMVNKEQFNEFVLPYLNKVFGKYKGALRLWHNEGKVGNKLEDIDKIDAEIWHFGPFDDETIVRAKTHFCLMGNIHPPEFEKCSPKEVDIKCKKLIEKVGIGKFWLSTGGGLAPNTPFKNIDALIASAKKYVNIFLRK